MGNEIIFIFGLIGFVSVCAFTIYYYTEADNKSSVVPITVSVALVVVMHILIFAAHYYPWLDRRIGIFFEEGK